MDKVIVAVSSGGAGVLLCTILVFLFRSWIPERVKQAIQHEYSIQLDNLRAEIRLKQDIAAATVQALAASSQVAHERRLAAIEKLWEAVIKVRDSVPKCVNLDELASSPTAASDFNEPKSNPHVNESAFDEAVAAAEGHKEVDRLRPFLGEYLYALFLAYRTLPIEFAAFVADHTAAAACSWWRATSIQALAIEFLSKQDLEELDRVPDRHLDWFLRKLEEKMLSAMEEIISGRMTGSSTLMEAKRIAERTRQLTGDA